MHSFISRFIRRLAGPIARVFLGLARASLRLFFVRCGDNEQRTGA